MGGVCYCFTSITTNQNQINQDMFHEGNKNDMTIKSQTYSRFQDDIWKGAVHRLAETLKWKFKIAILIPGCKTRPVEECTN